MKILKSVQFDLEASFAISSLQKYRPRIDVSMSQAFVMKALEGYAHRFDDNIDVFFT